MLHRAVTGSTERFMGVLIEHFAGAFPVWLAPVQAVLIPIADRHLEYCQKVHGYLKNQGLRVEIDAASERMNAKIRKAQAQKIPYMLIAGDREQNSDTISVRLRSGETLKSQTLKNFLTLTQKALASGE